MLLSAVPLPGVITATVARLASGFHKEIEPIIGAGIFIAVSIIRAVSTAIFIDLAFYGLRKACDVLFGQIGERGGIRWERKSSDKGERE